MTPSVLPKISTPRNLFFSHLPARVEASASGICRASASISVMACSAVVIELPNGVFITMMPRAVAAGISTLSTPMPARPITFRFLRLLEHFGRDLGGRADGQAVETVDRLGELVLVLAEIGLEIDLDAAILEDRDGGGRQRVGDENFAAWHELHEPLMAAFASAALALAIGPVEPQRQRFDIGALDGRAAPDAQARRRVAIGGDVVGDAFLVERGGDAFDEGRLRVGGKPGHRRIDDLAGRPTCWSGSPDRRARKSIHLARARPNRR